MSTDWRKRKLTGFAVHTGFAPPPYPSRDFMTPEIRMIVVDAFSLMRATSAHTAKARWLRSQYPLGEVLDFGATVVLWIITRAQAFSGENSVVDSFELGIFTKQSHGLKK